jgi:hypothetical protein
MFFMAFSLQPIVAVDISYLSGTHHSIKRRPVGATPPTFSCNCRLAGPVPLLCTRHLELAPGTWLTPLHAGMMMTVLR